MRPEGVEDARPRSRSEEERQLIEAVAASLTELHLGLPELQLGAEPASTAGEEPRVGCGPSAAGSPRLSAHRRLTILGGGAAGPGRSP